MLELLAMAAITATAVLVVLTIVSIYGRTTRQRILLVSAYVAWYSLVVVMATTGFLAPGGGVGVLGLAGAVTVPLLLLTALGLGTARARDAVAHSSLPRLFAIQIFRIVGVFFVLLYAAGRVPAPFGPSAGWGDVLVGVLAIPATLIVSNADNTRAIRHTLLLAFQALGVADLLIALTLGATSTPGPIQVFHQPATTAGMLTLPWILIPCFLVPSYLFLHILTLYRLTGSQASAERTPLRPATQSA